jgi:hypothetical protein
MDRALVNGAGDHLHGIGVATVAADYLDVLVSGEEHLMPLEHRLVGYRVGVVPVEIEHHLGDAPFGLLDVRGFRAEPELGAQRGLHAVAVQYLPLDLGSLDRLLADEVDLQGFLVFGADVLVGPDELARLPEEVLLQRLQGLGVIGEIRPIGLLPVPSHEL